MKLIHYNQPTKFTIFFLIYLYYILTLKISTYFNPHGINIMEYVSNNSAQNLIDYFVHS
jgi:hypothetical protein